MVLRTHSRQLSSVSPTIPAIRSILICGNPIDRAKSYARSISFDAVRAPVDLQDVVVEVLDAQAEPRDAQLLECTCSLPSVSVPGSHSKVTSSASSQGSSLFMPSTSRLSCWEEM